MPKVDLWLLHGHTHIRAPAYTYLYTQRVGEKRQGNRQTVLELQLASCPVATCMVRCQVVSGIHGPYQGPKVWHLGLPIAGIFEWLTQEANCLPAIVTGESWLPQSCWNCTQGATLQFVSRYKPFGTDNLLCSATTMTWAVVPRVGLPCWSHGDHASCWLCHSVFVSFGYHKQKGFLDSLSFNRRNTLCLEDKWLVLSLPLNYLAGDIPTLG